MIPVWELVSLHDVRASAIADFRQLYAFFNEHRDTDHHIDAYDLVQKQGHILAGLSALHQSNGRSILFVHPSAN